MGYACLSIGNTVVFDLGALAAIEDLRTSTFAFANGFWITYDGPNIRWYLCVHERNSAGDCKTNSPYHSNDAKDIFIFTTSDSRM